MFGINNMKIGKKIVIGPAIAMLFLLVLAFFSNDALKSDKETLNEIVQVKFELYKSSSKILSDVNLFNSVLYKIFSYATDGYEQALIAEQIVVLENSKKAIEKDMEESFAKFALISILTAFLLDDSAMKLTVFALCW